MTLKELLHVTNFRTVIDLSVKEPGDGYEVKHYYNRADELNELLPKSVKALDVEYIAIEDEHLNIEVYAIR